MRQAVRSASLIAFTVACGYAKMVLFPFLFFVELFSAATVLSGVLVGPAWGAWVGGVARLIFSLANPYGPPHPLVLVAQIAGGVMLGGAGGLWRGSLLAGGTRAALAWILLGLLGTVAYDALTNVAQGIVFGSIPATLAFGALPALQHVASNTAIFFVLGRLASAWLARQAGAGAALLAVILAAVSLPAAAAPPAAAAAGVEPASGVVAADSTVETPPDRGNVATPPDTSATLAPADTLAARSASRPPRSASRWSELDVDRLRLDGRTSARSQFREQRPYVAAALPLWSEAFDTPVAADAGIPFGAWRTRATDRTPVSGYLLAFGVPNAATAIGFPGRPANDPFLVTRWSIPTTRSPMERAGELLAAPVPTLWWESSLRDRSARATPTTSAVAYERGEGGLDQVGARFSSTTLGPGFAGGYTRRAADGAGALFRATEVRYAVAMALPRLGAWEGWIDADLATRRIESAGEDAAEGRVLSTEALVDDRRAALHLERRAGRMEQRLAVGTERAKHTSIDRFGARERWSEPATDAAAELRWKPSAGWTWLATARGARRVFHYRAGPAPTVTGAIDEDRRGTLGEGRVGLGVRRERARPSLTRRWIADLAYDAREGDRGVLDARLGGEIEGARAGLRLDLESAHQRATLEDRFFPEREDYFEDVLVLPKPVRYASSGNSALRPRKLNGVVAAAEWRPGRLLQLSASGSARYVVDDFGWELSRRETADSIFVDDRAVVRGSGWTSHLSAAVTLSWRSFRGRALGWARGGSESLSPRAGSTPRTGGDASVEAAAVLFEGDLPLRIGLEAHVAGARKAPLEAPSLAVFDASVRADFTDAGLFLRLEDLFDRRPPSGLYEIATDAGVPTTGRRLRFGVVWHLLD
jgi:hypothetical protein